MKLSELGTERALDVLCELTPYVSSIASDTEVIDTIGKIVNTAGEDGNPVNRLGLYLMFMERISEVVPLLFKTHRPDMYGIVSILSEKSIDEIKGQNFLETIGQVHEIFRDKAFLDFFKSLAGRGKTA